MASISKADELRAIARRRRAAATKKIGRIEKEGVKIGGSSEDPRMPVKAERQMTTPQLNRYIDKLNKFTERQNQYVRGNRGAPISRDLWDKYKGVEAKYNDNAIKAFENVKDIKLGQETLGQRKKKMGETEFPRAANPANNSPFDVKDRQPGGLTNNKALEELTKDIKKRNTKNFFINEAKRGKEGLQRYFENVGVSDYKEMVGKLTSMQYHALSLTNFANAVGSIYEFYKRLSYNPNDQFAQKQVDDHHREAKDLVDWARTIKRKIK